MNGKALADLRRPQRPDQGHQDRRPAGRRLRPAHGRRHHDVRQLAAFRRLHRGRQPRAAARQRRPDRPRHVPRLGLLLAGQPARHVQPRLRRRRGQAVGPAARSASSGTARSGWATCRTSKPDAPPGDLRRLHHAARRRRPPVLAGAQRRALPRALRGGRGARRQPAAPERSRSNPVSKRFSSDKDVYGNKEEFPIVCTTYRLTEHFHYWTQHQHDGLLNQVQPGFFVEIPEALAAREGHRQRLAGEGRLRARGRSRAWPW